MLTLVLSAILSTIALGDGVVAQGQIDCDTAQYPPLTGKHYQYPNQIPEKSDTNATCRGPQSGYLKCDSSTEGPNSQCQLAMMNSIDDFCLWGPPGPNESIADQEGATVAWCSKPGHGTRIMPQGTLTGVQVLKAPAYVLFAGTLKQENINMQAQDGGGEMDPHGADNRGNPLGSLVYTNAFPSNGGNANNFQQVIEWNNFMGSDVFCFKICDPSVANSKVYCNNIYDETGCNFNAPAAYQTGVFEVCESDNMDPVGVYTSNGQVVTYKQPDVVVTIPSIRTPASSKCTTYTSSALYNGGGAAAPTPTGSSASHPGSSTGGTSATPSGSGATSAKPTGTGTGATAAPNSASVSHSSVASTSSATQKSAAGVKVEGGMGLLASAAVAVVFGLGGVLAVL